MTLKHRIKCLEQDLDYWYKIKLEVKGKLIQSVNAIIKDIERELERYRSLEFEKELKHLLYGVDFE